MGRKQYADPDFYERKLNRVMDRLGADEWNYNWDRHGSWIEFRYRGELHRFDHTVEKAKENGVQISYGSDTFAQIVLALEDLARIVERGIYDFGTWIAGMRYLPPPIEIPECFRILGFETMPSSTHEIDARYRNLAKQYHPDAGGNGGDFDVIKRAAEQAKQHMDTTDER